MIDPAARPHPEPATRDAVLRQTAENLEATFLSEMLKSASFGRARQSFGGGVGEEQFSSLLRDEETRAMVQAGGIGLAESIFEAMKRSERNAD